MGGESIIIYILCYCSNESRKGMKESAVAVALVGVDGGLSAKV